MPVSFATLDITCQTTYVSKIPLLPFPTAMCTLPILSVLNAMLGILLSMGNVVLTKTSKIAQHMITLQRAMSVWHVLLGSMFPGMPVLQELTQ